MSKIDYCFKAQILKLRYYDKPLTYWIGKYTQSVFLEDSNYLKMLDIYKDLVIKYGTKVINECFKINHSSFERTKRLRDRVTDMITDNDCLFLTLTFTDEFLNKTIAKNRRKYITKFLRQFNSKFIANIDFGNKDEYIDENGEIRKGTHREHYHALIQIDKIDNKLYKYGSINFQRVHKTSEPVKLAKYIAKLTNHAIKETTKRNAIIYSR